MHRIVVGLDGSAESAGALRWAADLAALTGATITAMTAFDVGPYMSWGVAPAVLPDFDQLRAGLAKELVAWCKPLRDQGIPHDTVVREGAAAAEVIAEAEARETDLIVVGNRGRGGFRELVLGSVAHSVSHHTRHPVVIVPRTAAVSAPAEPAAVNSESRPGAAIDDLGGLRPLIS